MSCPETEFLENITKRLEAILIERGFNEDSVRQSLERWRIEVRRDYGGDRHYVAVLSNRQRDQKIMNEWSRRRHEMGIKQELANKYHLDRSTVSRLIAKHLREAKPVTEFASDDWLL
jgi:Mor family transcriptional regulator